MKKTNTIEITAAAEDRETAEAFIENRLKRSNISKEIRSETLLVFDALFRSILRQGFDENTPVTVRTRNSSGEIDIILGFEGQPFAAVSSEGDRLTEEEAVLQEYADKYDYSYQSGYNSIHIVVQRSFRNVLLLSLVSILAAILVYIPISACMSMETQIKLGEEIVFPLVKLFANAMLMIGAPVTFFSLVKNLTDIYVISERNSVGRKLQVKTIITSVIAVILAILAGFIIAYILNAQLGELSGAGGISMNYIIFM